MMIFSEKQQPFKIGVLRLLLVEYQINPHQSHQETLHTIHTLLTIDRYSSKFGECVSFYSTLYWYIFVAI